jgi:sulfur carrier protein ThiS
MVDAGSGGPITGDEKSQLVELLPAGTLKQRLGGKDRLLVESGQSIRAMLVSLELNPQSVIVIVNGRPESKEYTLQPGDQAKLLRLITGG